MHWYTLIPPVSEIPQEVPLEILLDRVTIYRRVAELGVQISEELASHDLCVMPVMNVGMFFPPISRGKFTFLSSSSRSRLPATVTTPPVKAEYKGHVWTCDFICDGTTRGGALRMLTILDDYTRECHVLRADRAVKSGDVLEWMSRAIQQHGVPAFLRSDNGS